MKPGPTLKSRFAIEVMLRWRPVYYLAAVFTVYPIIRIRKDIQYVFMIVIFLDSTAFIRIVRVLLIRLSAQINPHTDYHSVRVIIPVLYAAPR